MAINLFRGEHYYLSNMYPLRNGVIFRRNGQKVGTTEHAYIAEKFAEEEARKIVLSAPDGYKAKTRGRDLVRDGAELVEGWDDQRKISIMRYYVGQKFDRHVDLANKLAATGDEKIVEGNTRDDFWGMVPDETGEGQNWLGKIHMQVRSELQHGDSVLTELPAHY